MLHAYQLYVYYFQPVFLIFNFLIFVRHILSQKQIMKHDQLDKPQVNGKGESMKYG